jgi:NAD-dependent dihydropyrimidine dehydrogenase PreA subunit
MPKRSIVKIDEEKCTGCGECVPSCAEGAIQIIDGKARLKADNLCDGLGACLGDCPAGAITIEEREAEAFDEAPTGLQPSELRQWPVQLHLVSPHAPYFAGADLLLAADCTAFAMGDFHGRHLKGKALAIACPKLDGGQDVYLEKLVALIDEALVNTVTVMIMEVPCCGGLLELARAAAAKASRKVPVKRVLVGLQGNVIAEDWI